jgi:hypothetical protein
MDTNSAEFLINALMEAGVWTVDQAAAARAAIRPNDDANRVVESLKSAGPLTSYQIRKVRHKRIIDLTLGHFVILDKIGEGGMGKVYKAISGKIPRPVALKVVRPHLMSNKTVLRRYKREASAAAAMDHPNIVTLIDADELDGRYFLAMEYVEGSDLSRLVKENGALPYQEAAEYIRQSALGLQHAHERGLIHRDIKPSNLLVSGERALPGTDGIAHVKILDMGLVRSIMDNDDVSRTELTRDGTVVGTPDYMAPEQAKNSSKVDAKADLYSLGATLFYLLRAQSPFPDGSPIDKLLRHQLDPPPDLKKLRPDLPAGLVAIVNKLLRKKPEERYPNATALATALLPYTPNADAGLVLTSSAAATAGGDVSLDLPDAAAPTRTLVLDAEIVDAEIVAPATGAPPRTAPAPAAKKAAPKKIVRPAAAPSADPNSGSMPGAGSATRVTGATPTRVPAYRPVSDRTPSRSAYRRPNPKANPNRRILGIAFAAAGALVLLAGTILLFAGGTPKPKPTPKSTAPAPEPKPVVAPAPNGNAAAPIPHTPATLAGAGAGVADNAVAVLVVSPRAHGKAGAEGAATGRNRTAWLNWLRTRFAFDTRRLDRVTVSFLPRQGAVALGEGGGLTDDWRTALRERFAIADTGPGGTIAVRTFTPKDGSPASRPAGLLLGDGALAVASDSGALQQFGRRVARGNPAEGVEPGLLQSLPAADDDDPPLARFVAGKQWRLPDADDKSLTDYGVRQLVVTVRRAGEEYDVTMAVTGESEARIGEEFVSLGVATHLVEQYPALKPIQAAVTAATPVKSGGAGNVTLTYSAKWPVAEFATWLEPLLGDAPAL